MVMKRLSLHLTVGFLAFIIGVSTANRLISLRETLGKPQSPTEHTSLQIPPINATRLDEIPDLEDTSRFVSQVNQYSNYEYGYSITIPQGLVGLEVPAPFPQHGIAIILSKEPKSYIGLDGSYNSLEWKSLAQATEQHLKWLAEDQSDLTVLKRESITLQKLDAVRLIVRYKSFATNEIRVEDMVIAFRPNGGERRAITYTLSLVAPVVRYNEDVKTFEEIIAKWRMKQLPRA